MSATNASEPMPPLALLAGGMATRLRPVTNLVPKSMVLVAGEPFIAHQLRLLRRERITDIIICTGYLGEQISAFVGDGSRFGCQVRYAADGDRQLGTGGALRQALPLFGEHFFVMYGDSYFDIAFLPVYETFMRAGYPALMTVFRNANRWDTSNAEFADGIIKRYDKVNRTPVMQYIDYGLGVLSAVALARWPMSTPFDLAELYGDLTERGQLAGYEVRERFYEIGSPAGLAETAAHLSAELQERNDK
jgi:NDP-sugar pyrophosphorylase family protein